MKNYEIIVIVLVLMTAALVVTDCNRANVEIAKAKADTKRDWRFGFTPKITPPVKE
jgi:hypothetical protein